LGKDKAQETRPKYKEEPEADSEEKMLLGASEDWHKCG